MKYIRTYETEEKFLTDKDSTSREFRLKPTLYRYSETGNHVHLELDDPRKYRDEGSTYMEITLDSDTEFSFYIGNAPDNTETTMDCKVNWGDSTVDENLSITADGKGFKLSHSYKAGSYSIELHKVARDYSIIGDTGSYKSLISHPSSVKRVILGEGNNYGVGGVVSIGLKAFLGCSSLTSIHIPNGVTGIGDAAFGGCWSLTSIHIPNSVTSIGTSDGAGAFSGCSSLTSIHIPDGVTSIGDYAFYYCESLASIHIPEGVTSIGEGAFRDCSSLTSIHIPEGVTSIGESAFRDCSSLTSIHIPESVTSIGTSAFQYCTSLTSVYIPEGVTSIGTYAFYACSSLTSINIPEGITTINQYTFYRCSSLKSIDIPEKVTSIGDSAFSGCTSLTSISSFNPTTPTLGGNIFLNLPTNGTLHIKPGATGYDAWLSKLPEGWRIVEDL